MARAISQDVKEASIFKDFRARERIVISLLVSNRPLAKKSTRRSSPIVQVTNYERGITVCSLCGHVMKYSSITYEDETYCDQCFQMIWQQQNVFD